MNSTHFNGLMTKPLLTFFDYAVRHLRKRRAVATKHVATSKHLSMGPHTNQNAIQGGPKNWHTFYALTSSDIDRFSKKFRCLNQKNICNITVIKDPTIPKICSYTTL